MGTSEFINNLRKSGINLWVEGNYLRYSAPKGILTPTLRKQLVEHKAEIREFLLGAQNPFNTGAVAFFHDSETVSVALQTLTEEKLAQLWSKVFGIEYVGIHDDFFDLGSDSLLAMQITARVTQLGLSLAAHHLFEFQTISKVAAALDALDRSRAENSSNDFHHYSLSLNLGCRQVI